MWPKLRGQAGPAPNAGDQEPEPECDPQLELISIPDDSNVKHPIITLQTFFNFSKFQDPLHDLLQYVAKVNKFVAVLYVCICCSDASYVASTRL